MLELSVFAAPFVLLVGGSYLVIQRARRDAESTGGVLLIGCVGIVFVALGAFMLYAVLSYLLVK